MRALLALTNCPANQAGVWDGSKATVLPLMAVKNRCRSPEGGEAVTPTNMVAHFGIDTRAGDEPVKARIFVQHAE